jgi:hypothetical protein
LPDEILEFKKVLIISEKTGLAYTMLVCRLAAAATHRWGSCVGAKQQQQRRWRRLFSDLAQSGRQQQQQQSTLSTSDNSSTTVACNSTGTTADWCAFCAAFPAQRRAAFLASFRLRPAFVTATEEAEFLREMEPHLVRHKYERDHWDNVS